MHGNATPNPTAVIFDLDGTLLDSLRDLADSANATLRHFGEPEHPLKAYRQFIGSGVSELIRRVFPSNTRTPLQEAEQFYKQTYRENWATTTQPYTGIAELLSICHQTKRKTGVLSNKIHSFTVNMVETFFPGQFQIILGVEPGRPPKPDPSGALELAQLIGVPPKNCAFLGDSDVDILTAKAAGMQAWAALWGFRTQTELQSAGADRLWQTPDDITHFLR